MLAASRPDFSRAVLSPLTFTIHNGSAGVNETDDQLVRQSQAGDRVAFEELVRRTARLVFSRIYLDTGNRHSAEDLVQETFLSAWKSILQMTDPSGFRPWLLTIARTVTLDAMRRNTRRKRASPSAVGAVSPLVADPLPGPSEAAQSKEQQQKLLDVLRSLPEEYRLPITLRYLGGVDYYAIGQQLGLSNGALRGLLQRGMRQVRAAMTEKTDR